VGHLEANGFSVNKKNVTGAALIAVKREQGVPSTLRSCHTAVVQGYVIEGHVPADVIKRLLTDRPPHRGLGVPGMPVGSPGMEGPNPQPYDIFAFDHKGGMEVYANR
jgi:hypothetical protein